MKKKKKFEEEWKIERSKEEKEEEQIQNRQYENLLATHEKELRALHRHQNKDERNLQQQQHKDQHHLLKDLQNEVTNIHKHNCIEEEELQKTAESEALQLLSEQQNEQMTVLRVQHESQKTIWKNNLKRPIEEIAPSLTNEIENLQKTHQKEITILKEKLEQRLSQTRKDQRLRFEKLEQEKKEENEGISILHRQQRDAKYKLLKKRALEQSMSYKINQRDTEGQTNLHIAASQGDFQKAFRLIKDGIDINLQDKNGWTALHCAAYSKNKNVFSLLLQQSEIEVSHPNESGSTPLHYFCKKFEPEIYNEAEEHLVEQMIKKGSRVDAKNANGETALHNACWSKNLSIAKNC